MPTHPGRTREKEGKVKKSDLKEIIKPLVKECIHEVLLQEGLLSSVISEVVAGLGPKLTTEAAKPQQQVQSDPTVDKRKLEETRRRMMDAVGRDGYRGVDIFEGTTPLKSSGTTGQPTPSSPLDTMDPRDPGVDIGSIFGNKATSNWGKIAKGAS